jgi:hypothetical protein
LVTLAPVHDFIFKKQTLALDIDPSADNASWSDRIECCLRDLHVDEIW